MAGTGKKPPDRTGQKVYKCYDTTVFDSVICVVCEDVYHNKDFIRRKHGIYVSDCLAVCKEHNEVDLTSIDEENHVLTQEARYIIAKIKSNAKTEILKRDQIFATKLKELEVKIKEQESIISEQVKEINVQQNNITQLEQKITLNEKSKKNHYEENMDLDGTCYNEQVFEKAEIEYMKVEINLLRKLNQELEDKNILLKELLNKEKESENKKYGVNTFAEITARNTKPKIVPKFLQVMGTS